MGLYKNLEIWLGDCAGQQCNIYKLSFGIFVRRRLLKVLLGNTEHISVHDNYGSFMSSIVWFLKYLWNMFNVSHFYSEIFVQNSLLHFWQGSKPMFCSFIICLRVMYNIFWKRMKTEILISYNKNVLLFIEEKIMNR